MLKTEQLTYWIFNDVKVRDTVSKKQKFDDGKYFRILSGKLSDEVFELLYTIKWLAILTYT